MADALAAPAAYRSRLYGFGNEDQAAIVLLKGFELGLAPGASLEFVQLVMGHPAISPRGALALIYQSGELAKLTIDESDDACTVTMARKNGVSQTITWSQADSVLAGLVKSGAKGDGAHVTYPKNMRRWRAIGFCADIVFPDVLAGLKRADEFGATISEAGDVIDAEWESVPVPAGAAAVVGTPAQSVPAPVAAVAPPPPVAVPVARDPVTALNDLLERFGPAAILAAVNTIPSTIEECDHARAVLLEGAPVQSEAAAE